MRYWPQYKEVDTTYPFFLLLNTCFNRWIYNSTELRAAGVHLNQKIYLSIKHLYRCIFIFKSRLLQLQTYPTWTCLDMIYKWGNDATGFIALNITVDRLLIWGYFQIIRYKNNYGIGLVDVYLWVLEDLCIASNLSNKFWATPIFETYRRLKISLNIFLTIKSIKLSTFPANFHEHPIPRFCLRWDTACYYKGRHGQISTPTNTHGNPDPINTVKK